MPSPAPAVQLRETADALHGFVAADVAALVSEATLTALRRLVAAAGSSSGSSAAGACVTLADFKAAETVVRPSAMREVALEVPKVSQPGGGPGSTAQHPVPWRAA